MIVYLRETDMTGKLKRLGELSFVAGCTVIVLSAFLCGCDSRDNDDLDAYDFTDDETDVVHPENRRREETIAAGRKAAAVESDHAETSRNKARAAPAPRRAPGETPTTSRGHTGQPDRDGRVSLQDVAENMEDMGPVREARALVARLENEQGKARRQAAVALSGAVRKVQNEAALAEWISPLIEVKLKDTDVTVREYAGRALMSVLQGVNDQWALQPAVEALLDALDSDSATLKQRQYAAVALSVAVRKIKNEAFLEGIVQPLVMATTKDPDKGVHEYARRALMSALQRINDQGVLQPAVEALIDTLGSNSATLKRRQYAAVAVSATVRKIKDEAFLEGILQPLVMSTTRDPDKGVREYAGRAFLSVLNKVDDEAVLEPALGPLVETLGHKEVKMHRYAAWALANLVPKIRNEATLKQIIAPLTAAGSDGRHPHVREYCRRALKSIQTRLKQRSATGSKD